MPRSKTAKPRKTKGQKEYEKRAELKKWEYDACFALSKKALVQRIKNLQKRIEVYRGPAGDIVPYEDMIAIYTGAFACAETRGLIVFEGDGKYKWDYENGR